MCVCVSVCQCVYACVCVFPTPRPHCVIWQWGWCCNWTKLAPPFSIPFEFSNPPWGYCAVGTSVFRSFSPLLFSLTHLHLLLLLLLLPSALPPLPRLYISFSFSIFSLETQTGSSSIQQMLKCQEAKNKMKYKRAMMSMVFDFSMDVFFFIIALAVLL